MTDKKLTDNDVIKALECCSSHPREIKCDYCIAFSDGKCKLNTRQILNLINRQKAEIERLQEINDSFTDIGKFYSEIKAEAIKEFAEKMKEKIRTLDRIIVISEDVDSIAKEMLGEKE